MADQERREGFVQLTNDIAVIKVKLQELVGNGQPGIIKDHETRIRRLETYSWSAIGIIAFVQFLLMFIKWATPAIQGASK